MSKVVTLAHGDGGNYTQKLIEELFYKYFNNELLLQGQDGAVFPVMEGKMAFTTDSFVVKPVFFSGGNIGTLAVCGTINDLVVSGARPLYLSAGFIIEEGFPLESLEVIVKSMGRTSKEAGVKIITGDTKVVEKGSVDGIYINTSGIGSIAYGYERKIIEPGDKIIVTGTIGEHGTTIALQRYDIKVKGNFKSDCASLHPFVEKLREDFPSIKIMRDPTRGGLATVLNEFSKLSGLGICLHEDSIPITEEIMAINKLLGLDPLYMACEGRMVLVVKSSEAERILESIKWMEQGRNAKIIGEFIKEPQNTVLMENYFGGMRVLPSLEGNMLPRIC